MVKKVNKVIFGMLIVSLCFMGIGLKNDSYAATSDWSNHWAKDYIQQFIEKGYIGGYSDGTFKPNNSITRAEFVTIFNKTFGLTTTSGKVFNDTKTHWAKNEIDIAITSGVCKGRSATEFKPNDPITREEACVMISNYKKISDDYTDRMWEYKDKPQMSMWAMNSIEEMIERNYMGGYSDGTFRPKGKITRAEAVVTLSRVQSAPTTKLPELPTHISWLEPIPGYPSLSYGTLPNSGYDLTISNEGGRVRILIDGPGAYEHDVYAKAGILEVLKYYYPNTSDFNKAVSFMDANWNVENPGSILIGDTIFKYYWNLGLIIDIRY